MWGLLVDEVLARESMTDWYFWRLSSRTMGQRCSSKVAFKFKINEAHEIHRDPDGHYHHWTILVGSLLEGTIRAGDYIAIPSRKCSFQASIVLGICAGFGNQLPLTNERQAVTAASGPIELGIATWHPVPVEEDVEVGIATECSPRRYLQIIVDSWATYKEQYQSRDSRPAFRNVPETEALLRDLLEHSDTQLAELASEALKARPAVSMTTLPKRKWWQFWR